jgi:SAM-dependent methyltransferase
LNGGRSKGRVSMCSKTKCPICNSSDIVQFLKIVNTSVHQNMIIKDKTSAKLVNKGNLNMHVCNNCTFIFNSEFDESKLEYGEFYDNTQDFSQLFIEYVDDEIEYLINRFRIYESRIVEVGCGKGNFLVKLAQKSNSFGYGFDPSYVGNDEELGGRVKFVKAFYDEKCTDYEADIIICRHVIEHIEDPIFLLNNIKKALKNTSNAIVFFETPCSEWILDNKIIYDFFYEHCSYFNKKSIIKTFEIAGFEIIDVIHRFGGQYMWVMAKIGTESAANENTSCEDETSRVVSAASNYGKLVENAIERWRQKLKLMSNHTNIAVWGAGAKGVTFTNLIDPNALSINCIIDINPKKQGGFIPGTGHEIISYKEIEFRNITSIIVMNTNYLSEIKTLLKDYSKNVNILSGEDLL